MSFSNDDDTDWCSLCQKPLVATDSEKWQMPDEEWIAVPKCEIPYILADTPTGEIWICEECYKKGSFGGMGIDILAEIHYEFGLVYGEFEHFSESVDALHRGLRLKQTPDMLAAIAFSYGRMGDHKLEREFYQQALALDPTHFMASENLKNMDR